MTAAEHWGYVSIEDYLAAEEASEVKHEYFAGIVYAMAGGKVEHNLIATNVTSLLHAHLRGHPCQAFNSDMKVRVQASLGTRFYYPDGMVVCSSNRRDESHQDNPVVLIEVLSDSTRRTDEGEKKEAYMMIPSLRSYIMLDSDRPAAQVWQRDALGAWQRSLPAGPGAEIPLPEIEMTLRLEDIYEGLDS